VAAGILDPIVAVRRHLELAQLTGQRLSRRLNLYGARDALAGALDAAVAGVLGDLFRSDGIPVPGKIHCPVKDLSRTRRTAASCVVSPSGHHDVPIPRTPANFSGLATKCMVRTKPSATSRTSAEIGLPPAATTTPGPPLTCAK
jgi:hypothetical protein